MKILALLSLLVCSGAYAQMPGTDIVVSGGGITITVRGSGGFACAAQDSMKKRPRLGRGVTMQEAAANAHYLATLTSDMFAGEHDDFFVESLGCEGSNSGSSGIFIQSDASGLHVTVEGTSAYQCISTDSMKRNGFPYIATAGTQTEASALSGDACTSGSHNNGFFCETKCQAVSFNSGVTGGMNLPNVKLGKIKLPKIRFPFHL